MTIRLTFGIFALAASMPMCVDHAAAQSAAGAPIAEGKTRPYGRPFSGHFVATTARDEPVERDFGSIYAVLDGKGKIGINGTFEGLTSPAVAAYLHKGVDGRRGNLGRSGRTPASSDRERYGGHS